MVTLVTVIKHSLCTREVIRVMASAQKRESFRKLLKKFQILAVVSKYLLPLKIFIIVNLEVFQTNSVVHAVTMRYKQTFTDQF